MAKKGAETRVVMIVKFQNLMISQAPSNSKFGDAILPVVSCDDLILLTKFPVLREYGRPDILSKLLRDNKMGELSL